MIKVSSPLWMLIATHEFSTTFLKTKLSLFGTLSGEINLRFPKKCTFCIPKNSRKDLTSLLCAAIESNCLKSFCANFFANFHLENDLLDNLAFNKINLDTFFVCKIRLGQISDSTKIDIWGFQ